MTDSNITESSENTVTIRRPDDWHLHLRDGAMLRTVLPFTTRVFKRAIVMPNLVPPLTTVNAVNQYKEEIVSAIPKGHDFEPLMTFYLTDTISKDEVETGFRQGLVTAAKLYPAGATTNSEFGVTEISRIHPVLDVMERIGMPLLVHGEVADAETDVYDREAVFIDRVLEPLRRNFPALKIVFEHLTSAAAVDYVQTVEHGLAATITPHHLMINRNALFRGGLRPHLYCLPIAKRERDRLALRRAATSGDARFFLGTDSAPHVVGQKECDAGCAGVFNAAFAMECVAQVFDEESALGKLESFASLNGPAFYELSPNEERFQLRRRQEQNPDVPLNVGNGESQVRVFCPDAGILWEVLR